MERKKRVSVGVVLMGFFLFFVMLAAAAGLVAHEVLLREGTSGMSSKTDIFSIIGALHILLELTFKGGESWVRVLGANAKDYFVIGLMMTGILMFIIAGFTKNHIVYLISLLMTGTSVFMKRLPALIYDIRVLPSISRAGGAVQLYGSTRFLTDLFIILAWILLMVVWLISVIKHGKVKRGTGDPDRSLVIGFIPGLLMILAYLGLGTYEVLAVASADTEMSSYVLGREFGSAWVSFPEVEIFGALALIARYLFLSFQFGLLILFVGLWLNRPYKKLSAEERAAAALAAKKAAEPKPEPMSYNQPYGAPYGAPYGQPYGPQYNPQYGQQMNPQYGQPVNPQYGQPYGQQYSQQMNQQYGQQYAPQYNQQMDRQYGAAYAPQPEPQVIPEPQPEPQPVPVPVPVFTESVKEEAEEKAEEVKEAAEEKFEEVKEETAEKFEEVKEETAEKFEEVKEEASEKFEEVKEELAEKFEEVKEEAAEAVEAVQEEMPAFKFCPDCGCPLDGPARFCPRCGSKLYS